MKMYIKSEPYYKRIYIQYNGMEYTFKIVSFGKLRKQKIGEAFFEFPNESTDTLDKIEQRSVLNYIFLHGDFF